MNAGEGRRYIPWYTYLGVAFEIILILARIFNFEFILKWGTPIFWTGYILILDGVVFSFKGKTLLGKVVVLGLISVVFWWFFEWLNIFISNWHYRNLPSLTERYIGYIWAFATIIPAVLLTYNVLLIVFRDIRIEWHSLKFKNKHLSLMILGGISFLLLPIVPFSMMYLDRAADSSLFFWLKWFGDVKFSEYMAAFVFLSLFFILDPINYLMGKPSIIGFIDKGNYKVIVLLSLAGLICGILWEFENFFLSIPQWYYTVPILGHIKIFEMPVLGYLGFIPFVWEAFCVVSFVYKDAIVQIQEWLL
jgi:hypothetical protein